MAPAQQLFFPPFLLDLERAQLQRDGQVVPLKPKTFSVLRCLVEHAGQIVTREALHEHMWPDSYVTNNTIKVHLRALRKALNDDSKSPRYIETMLGRGYRFVAAVTPQPGARGQHSVVSRKALEANRQESEASVPTFLPQSSALGTQHSAIVGRGAELAQLQTWFEKARHGERQIVFIAGEPGIGKTSLIETFLQQVAAEGETLIARGQCIDQYGHGESYMPVLSALGRLCREPAREKLIPLLNRHAPLWLMQMPSLLGVAKLEELRRRTLEATPERMMREMVEFMAALTEEQALVLWLDDLHWSDYSTVALLSALARQRDNARLFVIGAFRPVEVLGNGHPLPTLLQELHTRDLARVLTLTGLSAEAVAAYITMRFPDARLTAAFTRAPYERTEGNPLFLVKLVDELVRHKMLTTLAGQQDPKEALRLIGAPRDLQQLIATQFSHLTRLEQQTLGAASVNGIQFSTAAVAAALDVEALHIEDGCESLAQRTLFLQPHEEYSGSERQQDGQYRFLHALYPEVVQKRFSAARRRHWHQRIGAWKEAAYGKRALEYAAELAMHFEQGQDYPRTITYLEQAARNALQRGAYQEAINYLRKGLNLQHTLPETPERLQSELTLRMILGVSLVATKGYAAPEVENTYRRAQELCEQVGTSQQLLHVLSDLGEFYIVRAAFPTAYRLGRRLWKLARRLRQDDFALAAHMRLGVILHYLGRPRLGRRHHARGVALYRRRPADRVQLENAQDPGVFCLGGLGILLWYLGFPEQALSKAQETLMLAQQFDHPHNFALALSFAAEVYNLRREGSLAQASADQMIALAQKHMFPFWESQGLLFYGGALLEQGRLQESIIHLQRGLEDLEATGARIDRLHFLALLADAYRREGRYEESVATLTRAFTIVKETNEHLYEPELYRIKGELLLQKGRLGSGG